MKSIILLFGMVVLFIVSAFADGSPDMQYVHSQNGDTLVVKDDIEFGSGNTLYLLIKTDSMAPATRVYMLQASGTYSCANNPQSSTTHKTIIMGPEQNIKKGTTFPPVVCGLYDDNSNTTGGMQSRFDLLVKNINFSIGNTNGGSGGWAFFGFSGPDMKLQVDNCILEHTWWCWVGGPPQNSTVKFTNDYFVNMDGHTCRRNGGITDFNSGSAFQQDTLLVENCTHVNFQGTAYKFRDGYVVNRAIFNHNDFIDMAGYVIMNNGDQTNLSITNNIYVNCQLQDMSVVLESADKGEVDNDGLPMGLVNLRVDSTFTANVGTHGVYVDKNLAYWDPSLDDIDATLNANSVDNRTDWTSQRIPMNSRTTDLFADDANYSNLYNGTWFNKLPNFAGTDVLFTTRLATLKSYAMACVDTTFGTPLSSWRQAGNAEADAFVYADFPIPIDLSYDDADLKSAGLGGYPLGDLNWFPTELANWKTQASTEMAAIQDAVDTGNPVATAVHTTTQQLPKKFELQQNYPNPFNPTTEISYTIGKAGNVSLKIYNLLGQEVATLVNGYQAANTYTINFNASHLSSGVYLYELRAGNNVVTKKMTLMK
jgi:hypothetical protein